MTTISTYEQSAIDFLASTGTIFSSEYVKFDKYFPDDTEARNIFNCTLSNERHSYTFKFGQSIASSTNVIEKPQHETTDIIEVYAGMRWPKTGISVGESFKIHRSNNFGLDAEVIEEIAYKMEKDYYLRSSARNKQWISKYESGNISKKEMLNEMEVRQPIGAFIQCVTNAIQREKYKTVAFNIEANEKVAPTAYDVLSAITKYPVYDFEYFCGDYGYDSDSRKAYKIYKAVKKEWENISLLFSQEQLELLQEIN